MYNRTIRLRFLQLFFLFYVFTTSLTGQVRVEWAKNYGNERNNIAYTLSKINDNSFLIAGTSWRNSNNQFDYSVYAIDETGHTLWSHIYGDENNEVFYDALAVDDGIILTGYSEENSGSLSITKISLSGDVLWTNIYPDFYNATSKIFKLSNGNLFIAATSENYETSTEGGYGQGDITLLKLNTNGELLFRKNYGGSRFDKLNSGILSDSDDLFLVGQTWSDDGIFQENKGLSDGFIIKIDTNGNLLWEKVFGNEFEDELADIIQTNDGDFVAVGTIGQLKNTLYTGDLDNLLIRINSSGELIWGKTIGTDENEKGKAITSLGNSYIFTSTVSSHNQDIAVYKTNNNGIVVFDTLFIGEERDIPTSILSDAGLIYIAGYSRSDITDFYGNNGQYDMWAIRINGLSDVELPLPECVPLTTPSNGATDVGIHEQLTWTAAPNASGYKLTIGTIPGGTDVLDDIDLGNVLAYDPGTLLCQTNYYISIIPYNLTGEPIGCSEQSFTTTGITAIIGNDIAFCQGESGEISASGGEQYSWAPTLGLNDPNSSHPTVSINETTTYTVTITGANGCTDTGDVMVTVNPTPQLNISSTDETALDANDGTATASPNAGTPPFEYSWSNGGSTATIIDLTPDDYTVTVTDANGCSTNQTVTILSHDCSSLEIESNVSNISCYGADDGAVYLIPNGDGPFSFIWNNGDTTAIVNNLFPDSYKVTITDANGCHMTLQFSITEPDELIAVTEITQPSTEGNDGSISITPLGGTPPYEILWTTGDTDFEITNMGTGNYVYLLSDANDCTYKDSIDLIVVAIDDIAIADDLIIFPNPNSGHFEITWQTETTDEEGLFALRNQLGQILWQKQVKLASSHQSIDLYGKTAGIYTLEITTKNGKIVRMVVIQ